MSRWCLGLVGSLVVCVGTVLAGDATVVRYEADDMKLVVREGDKERTLQLKKTTHVHDVDGREIRAGERAAKLTSGVLINIEEKDGRIIEINLKKKK